MNVLVPIVQPAALPVLRPAAAEALNVTPEQLLQRWLVGLSPSTVRSYRRGLHAFAAWALDGDAEPAAAVRLLCGLDAGRAGELVRSWRDTIAAAGKAPSTVASYCTAVASVLAACRRAGIVNWTLEGVAPRVEARQDRSGPRRGDVERLFGVVDDRADAGDRYAVRDACLLRLLYVAALRRAEAGNIRVEDYQQTDVGPVVMVRRKGRKERSAVLVSTSTAAAVDRWLSIRGADPGPMLQRIKGRSSTSGPLSGEAIRKIVAVWAHRAGLRAVVRPHGLRHAAASFVAQRASLAELMATGGWSSLSAAKRYIDAHAVDRQKALAILEL